MEQSEAISMLKSLIANIEAGHVEVREVKAEDGGSLTSLTLTMSGNPKIRRTES